MALVMILTVVPSTQSSLRDIERRSAEIQADASENLPPVASPISMIPSADINTGTKVGFVGCATDLEGDLLDYSWDFGDFVDNNTSSGQTTTHQFIEPGLYTVTMNVTDNQPGIGRPASVTILVSVSENAPPTISMPGTKLANRGVQTLFSANASDEDDDPLRFTWDWGDGSRTVTTTPSTTHTYFVMKNYNLVVHADDMKGLDGHNVSATCIVSVKDLGPTPPHGVTLSALPLSVWTGQNVTFTGSAQDLGGDAMQFNFTFGDGAYEVMSNPATAPDQVVTSSVTHAYTTAGTKGAYMYATDGWTGATSYTVFIQVTLNTPPVLVPQTVKYVNNGTAIAFSATASDTQEATLRYTWNFGDGSPLVVSRTTTHTYPHAGKYTFTVCVDDLTGVPGHNVSSSAVASVAFGINLVAGWNLVSLPLVEGLIAVYKASTLPGLVIGDLVVEWKPSTQTFNHTYIKGISGAAQNFALNTSTGYWIWVGVSKTIWIYGSVPTTLQTLTITVPAGGGWVALGLTSLKAWHASDIPEMYDSTGRLIVISTFDPIAKLYKNWLSAVPTLNDFQLVPGQGFWCYATASGVLSYMP